MTTVDITKEESTIALAQDIAKKLTPGRVVALIGDLGSGKTFFARHLIRALMRQEVEVVSPTFQLLQIYPGKDFDIYHYDLYRLENSNDIYELAFEDAFSSHNITIIEWPEIIQSLLPKKTIRVTLTLDSHEKRFAQVSEI